MAFRHIIVFVLTGLLLLANGCSLRHKAPANRIESSGTHGRTFTEVKGEIVPTVYEWPCQSGQLLVDMDVLEGEPQVEMVSCYVETLDHYTTLMSGPDSQGRYFETFDEGFEVEVEPLTSEIKGLSWKSLMYVAIDDVSGIPYAWHETDGNGNVSHVLFRPVRVAGKAVRLRGAWVHEGTLWALPPTDGD